MPETEIAQKLPPYVPFRSFMKLLDSLRVMMPGRLDSGYMGAQKFSGSIASQVLTACRFLGLVKGMEPEDTLKALSNLQGDQWEKTLEKIIRTAYAPIFEMNLENATESMLREKFKKAYGADGEVASKVIAFFVQACAKAKIPISPLITKKVRSGGTPRPRRRRESPSIGAEPNGAAAPFESTTVPPPALTSPAEVEWAKFRLLVDKFPRFDPTWPDELKKKWFETYEQFMKTNLAPARDRH